MELRTIVRPWTCMPYKLPAALSTFCHQIESPHPHCYSASTRHLHTIRLLCPLATVSLPNQPSSKYINCYGAGEGYEITNIYVQSNLVYPVWDQGVPVT